jgi:hypothetical protein
MMLVARPPAVLSRRARRALLAACSLVSLMLLCLPAAAAAVPPAPAVVTIESPQPGTMTNNQTPEFRGTTSLLFEPGETPVNLTIHHGASAKGEVVAEPPTEQQCCGYSWSAVVKSPLRQGTYTAVAELSETPEARSEVTFVIDTAPPAVTITYPPSGASASGQTQLVTGAAGTESGDVPSVSVELFAGPVAAPPAIAERIAAVSGVGWSAAFGGLSPGTYTVLATQRDQAGNAGSSTATFALTPAVQPAAPAPSASFTWFPAAPVVGQSVVLASSSTDAASPLSSFAWDLAGNGTFRALAPVIATSFSTPGNHLVRLRVGDLRGASSVVAETVRVSPQPLKAMEPFPIVRIAGVQTAGGVRLSLLSVQSPIGARVTVACRGRACRMKPQSRIATASAHNRKAAAVVLAFRRFERSFRAGVTLEVRVSARGELGKYTSFSIHRRTLPTRIDECLSALDPQPITCPA